jgi:hypothetical protein
MAPTGDLLVFDRAGRMRAVVEVKNKRGTTSQWASELRRNMLMHGSLSHSDFFVLVTPDRMYFWKGTSTSPAAVPPTFEMAAEDALAPYFAMTHIAPGTVTGEAFELLVAAWLNDMARSGATKSPAADQRVAPLGFLEVVRGGRVAHELAA